MKSSAVRRAVPLLLLAGSLLGCGPSASRQPARRGGQTLTEISPADLPGLADYLPPLDGGRIEVAAPIGWTFAPRSRPFLARFVRSAGERYPTILLTAGQSPSVPDVARENVAAFAAAVAREENVRQATPVAIGEFIGVAYRKRGKEPGSTSQVLDRLLLATAAQGRRYTLELRARAGELDEASEDLYAVAEGLRFSRTAADQPAPSAPEQITTSEPHAAQAASGQPPRETPEVEPSREAQTPEGEIDLDKELKGLFDLD